MPVKLERSGVRTPKIGGCSTRHRTERRKVSRLAVGSAGPGVRPCGSSTTDHSVVLNIASVDKLINMQDERQQSNPAPSGIHPRLFYNPRMFVVGSWT